MNQKAAEAQGYTVRGSELWIEDVPISRIAQNCPTPLYIYSTRRLREAMQEFSDHFRSTVFHTRVYYASKAFNVKAMLELVQQAGLGVDVVSAGELYTALQAGFDPAMILFHGNNKSEAELRMCLAHGVGCIVMDNIQEAASLAALKKEYPEADPSLLLRINPNVDAHTHKYIVTAHVDSKFGINRHDMQDILDIVHTVVQAGYTFAGFHAHIGSQIFQKNAFLDEIRIMGQFISDFTAASGIAVHTLDLGGGFAAWYTDDDAPIPVSEVCSAILDTCASTAQEFHLQLENIWIEPGRSITANAGATLYTVGQTKKTPHKHYAFVDGGMADNIRPALYQADYTCDLPLKMDQPDADTYCVAGKCCESGDIVVPSCSLPAVEPGDLLLVYTTGAYGYSMASRYNKLPVPGVLFIDGEKAYYAVQPETLEDLIRLEEKKEVF